MSILTWIEDKKRRKLLNAPKYVSSSADSNKGLWTRCDKCGVILYIIHLKENQRVCFGCSYHLQMMSQERIENLLDKVPAMSFRTSNSSLPPTFPHRAPTCRSLLKKSFPFAEGVKPSGAHKEGGAGAQRATRGEGFSGGKGNVPDRDKAEIIKKGFCKSVPYRQKVSSAQAKIGVPYRTAPMVGPRGSLEASLLRKDGAFAGIASTGQMISTWRPLDETLSPCDPLKFHDQKNYTDRLKDAQEKTGLQDAVQTGTGMIDGIPVALAVMDFSFMGGSMGSVVGEKITRLIEYATREGLTLLIISASGGARMQEGVFSLMQMAKISSALQIYQSCAKLLYISILTSPTTGGVTASFAMLGDIIFAEPKALIAFTGRRVIEQTIAEDLPEDFQTSESMFHHGLIDLIVPRRFLRQALSETIRLYQNASFKKVGTIPFGVQNPITFLTEEKIRRQTASHLAP